MLRITLSPVRRFSFGLLITDNGIGTLDFACFCLEWVRQPKGHHDNHATIRVPSHLADDLKALASELQAQHEKTGKGLEGISTDYPDRSAVLPPWVAIAKALRDYRSHRERGRGKKVSKATSTKKVIQAEAV